MTTAEILTLRSEIMANAASRLNSHSNLFMRLLCEFGFRGSEIYDLDQAIMISQNIYQVPTKKFGLGRVCDFSSFSDEVGHIMQYGSKSIFQSSIETYRSDFNRCIDRDLLSKGKKGIELHFFRHAKVKELIEQGYTEDQVKMYLGLSKLSTVFVYKDSIIV